MPKGGEAPFNGAPDLVRFRDIGDNRDNASSGGRCDLLRRAFDVSRRQGVERDVGAGLGEHLGDPLADAAPGSGDEDDLSGDIEFSRHHDMSSAIAGDYCRSYLTTRRTRP